MTIKQFYISIITFLSLEYIFIFFILPNIYTIQSEKEIFIIPLFVIFIVTLQYYLLQVKIKKNKENFIVPFIAIFGGKFLFLLFASLIYILYFSKNNTEFVFFFFVNYFISIILSMSSLAHVLKNK